MKRLLAIVALCLAGAVFVSRGDLNSSQPTPVLTVASASASGAPSIKFINASGSAVNVKASGGNLYGFCLTNETASVEYVEFFNTASAPTLGTTAVVFAIKVPASANVCPGQEPFAMANFSSGIGFGSVTAENGSTTASVSGVLFYQ